jgi:hypothetical protein
MSLTYRAKAAMPDDPDLLRAEIRALEKENQLLKGRASREEEYNCRLTRTLSLL